MSDTSDLDRANSGATLATPIKAAANTATVGLILCGLIYAATPYCHDAGLPSHGCSPTATPTAAERELLVADMIGLARVLGDLDVLRREVDRPARSLLIHPIWRP